MADHFISSKLTIKPSPRTHPAITLSESKKCEGLGTASQQNSMLLVKHAVFQSCIRIA